MTERPDLKTPGRLLSGARRAKGLSLAAMSERTKIPPPVIEALEADEYHKVSGALYIKSFLRTCAVELGVDEDEVLALYAGMSGGEASGPRGGDMVWQEDEVQISHVGLPWRAIALAGAALVLIGLGGLTLIRGCGVERGELAADVAPAPERAAEPPAGARTDGAAVLPDSGLIAAVGPDTLAGGGPAATPAAARKDEATEAPDEGPAVAETPTGTPAATRADPAPAPASATGSERGTGPLPVVGNPGLVFAGGAQWKVVARVISTGPVAVEVRRDRERGFAAVAWPADPAAAPDLPPTGVEPGRVYRVSRGYAIYFGADDNMGLRLGSTAGVEVRVNGRLRDISNLRAGAELLLDATGN